jgi:hypothetical protein
MQKLLILASVLFWSVVMLRSGAAQTAVTTYHYDNLRTGWNQTETVLTTTNVNQQNFVLLHTVQLDVQLYDQVDAQPLFVPSQYIAPNSDSLTGGTYDVVFVATESNNVYAIDASAGVIVNRKNLGSPVPQAVVGGSFNGPNVGIYGTPVIDPETQTLYVIAFVYVNGTPTYQLHALDLSTFADKGNSPLTVSPPTAPISQLLTDGTTFTFSTGVEQQRAGLVLFFERVRRGTPPHFAAVAHLYAGFGSFNDIPPGRGWLLGWTAVNGAGGITLAQLPENLLLNTQPTSFLGGSSIWMSGYGIASAGGYSSAAAAVSGRGGKATQPELFFTTGNNLPGPHDGVTNISDSVVRVSGVDASVIGVFTPTNVGNLDNLDFDFSSGGAMLLPPQAGNFPDLAVAAGKDGNLYLLNRDAISGSGSNTTAVLNPLSPAALQTAPAQTAQYLGSCFCGPSYFMGSDGIGRVVTSQGASPGNEGGPSSLITWRLVLSPSGQPQLVREGIAPLPTSPTTSFFTVVSSNGTQAGSAIIWAVATTPTTTAGTSAVTLYAFDAVASDGTLKQLFLPLPAGTWPSNYHSIAVPVVADGKVFVASNNQLFIFGATPLACPPGEGWIEKGNGYQCIPIPVCPASCRFGCLIDNVPPGPIRFICKIYGKIP